MLGRPAPPCHLVRRAALRSRDRHSGPPRRRAEPEGRSPVKLFISHNTVKSHLKTAYRKLGVASREDAIGQLAALEAHAAVPARSRQNHRANAPGGWCCAAAHRPGFWHVRLLVRDRRLPGELDDRFGDAFADLSVRAINGNTELTGRLRDQSQLLGVLRQLFDLALDIESMSARLAAAGCRRPGG